MPELRMGCSRKQEEGLLILSDNRPRSIVNLETVAMDFCCFPIANGSSKTQQRQRNTEESPRKSWTFLLEAGGVFEEFPRQGELSTQEF